MKKQFLVSKVKADADITGVSVDGKEMNFSKSGSSFYMKDAAEARDVDQAFGSGTDDPTVVVSEVPMANREGIHNYTWSINKPDLDPGNFKSDYAWVTDGKGKAKRIHREELGTYLDNAWEED